MKNTSKQLIKWSTPVFHLLFERLLVSCLTCAMCPRGFMHRDQTLPLCHGIMTMIKPFSKVPVSKVPKCPTVKNVTAATFQTVRCTKHHIKTACGRCGLRFVLPVELWSEAGDFNDPTEKQNWDLFTGARHFFFKGTTISCKTLTMMFGLFWNNIYTVICLDQPDLNLEGLWTIVGFRLRFGAGHLGRLGAQEIAKAVGSWP